MFSKMKCSQIKRIIAHSITYKGADVTSWLTEDGQFTTPAISVSTELNISYEQVSTGIKKDICDNPIRVNAYRGNLMVSGTSSSSAISVYDLSGRLLTCLTAYDHITNIDLDTSDQIVIVKVADKVIKVQIK